MELINYAITAIIAALVGALSQILVARYSKPKQERGADLVDKYIKITDMTAEQLEEKINQIARLETKVDLQKKEIDGLNARITSMVFDGDVRDKRENERNKAIADKIQGLEDYIKTLINALREHDIDIPPRPDILKDGDTLEKIKAVR